MTIYFAFKHNINYECFYISGLFYKQCIGYTSDKLHNEFWMLYNINFVTKLYLFTYIEIM